MATEKKMMESVGRAKRPENAICSWNRRNTKFVVAGTRTMRKRSQGMMTSEKQYWNSEFRT
jgi:hypothetical protein